tara:strand:- start:275 stop:1531 length:1257 start_codon:yes stop_codon:yes gene_type:complete
MKFLKNFLKKLPSLNLFNTLSAVFIGALAWAFLFELDKSVNVPGLVEPKGNVISIQNRFDGKIKEVVTSNGNKVKKGDILFVLAPDQDEGGLREKVLEVQTLELKKRRLDAQLKKLPSFEKNEKDDPATFRQELSQLTLELGAYNTEIETLKSEQNIVYREIASAELSADNLEKLAELMRTKYDVTKKLYTKQYEGKLALLEAEQKLSESLSNIAVARENLQRLFEKTNSLDKKIEQLVLNFDRDVSAEISEVSRQIQFAKINLDTLQRRVEEFEVKSPADGIISKVFFNNVGEVVAQASTLGELIPEGRPLIFAAKLKPGDILEVTKGQETLITLNNMDTRTEPPLIGHVSNVEKNSRVDENFGRYFQVEINFTNPNRTNLIVPGVDGSASILLGKRSVIEYILEPIISSFRGALSE